MKFDTKFSIRDKVYHIGRKGHYHFTPCYLCEGAGTVELKNNNAVIKCPKCYGAKGNSKYITTKWQASDTPVTISHIRLYHTDSKGYLDKIDYSNFSPQKSYREEYMAVETGTGSGSLYKAEDLFTLRREAKQECHSRNLEMLDEENQEIA